MISMGVLSSCIDHPERSRENFKRGQFRKRVIKPIGGVVLTTFLVDTSFNVNDTILVNDNKVVIIR
jgi:hypothetical protein